MVNSFTELGVGHEVSVTLTFYKNMHSNETSLIKLDFKKIGSFFISNSFR